MTLAKFVRKITLSNTLEAAASEAIACHSKSE